jgi:hypothetical protein
VGLKKWLIGAVVVPAVVAPAGALHAQFPTAESMGLNYSITAGVAFLANRNMPNTTLPMIGLAWYDVAGDELGASAVIGVTADWTQIKRYDGKTVQYLPVMLNYRQYGIIGGYRVFVNLGAGVLAATDSISDMNIKNGATFGWTGGMGVDLTNNLYFQGRFIGGKSPGDDGLTSVQMGYRF